MQTITLILLVLVLTTACGKGVSVIVDRSVIVLSDPPVAMTDLSAPVTNLLKSFVSEQSGLPAGQISLQQAQAVTWNDSCLGLAQPDELCLQAITSGYRVTFTTPKGNYIVHSSPNGRSRRLAIASQVEAPKPLPRLTRGADRSASRTGGLKVR